MPSMHQGLGKTRYKVSLWPILKGDSSLKRKKEQPLPMSSSSSSPRRKVLLTHELPCSPPSMPPPVFAANFPLHSMSLGMLLQGGMRVFHVSPTRAHSMVSPPLHLLSFSLSPLVYYCISYIFIILQVVADMKYELAGWNPQWSTFLLHHTYCNAW